MRHGIFNIRQKEKLKYLKPIYVLGIKSATQSPPISVNPKAESLKCKRCLIVVGSKQSHFKGQ